jgi:hypothetical protein
MLKRLAQLTRDLTNWIVPPVILALAVFVFNLPLLLSLILAFLVFTGLFFILNPRSGVEEAKDESQDEVAAKLKDTRAKIGQLRVLAKDVQKQQVREHILKICDLADSTVGDLISNKDTSIVTATRLSSTFAQTLEILQLYRQLASGQVKTEPAKRDAILAKIEGDILSEIESSLHDFALKLDQGEVVNLEAAIRVLESTLKLEGIS